MAKYPKAPGRYNLLKYGWIEPETDEYKKYFEELEKYYENIISSKAREEEEAKLIDETTNAMKITVDNSSEEGKNSSSSSRQPRFQLFWALISLDKYKDLKSVLLHGHIKAYQEASSSSSCEEEESDFDSFTLLKLDSGGAEFMNNYPINNLITQFSFAVNATTSSLGLNLNLSAKYFYEDDSGDGDGDGEHKRKDKDNGFFQLCNVEKLELVEKSDTFCIEKIDLHDGSLYMGYIVLSDPVDAALDITFKADHDVSEEHFMVRIYALYGNNYGADGGCYQVRRPSRYQVRQPSRYHLPLFNDSYSTLSDDFKFQLMTSSLAVPATSTLNIRAKIFQMSDGGHSWDSHFCFVPVRDKSSATSVSKGPGGCSLVVKVNWNYPPIASHQGSREESRERSRKRSRE